MDTGELEKANLQVDYPNKVFREIHMGASVVPITPAD